MADGLIFGVGVVEIQVGTDPAIQLGVLQNVSIDISTSSAELRGGQSLMPVKVAITERSITGSAEFAKLDANAVQVILGGEMTTDTVPTPDKNTITIKDTDKPVEFKLTLKEPTDGSNVSIVLNRCLSTSFAMAFAYDNFMIPSFNFTAMSDASGNIMTMVLPVL